MLLQLPQIPRSNTARAATVLVLALALSACGNKEKPATQVVAKVNKDEISIHQVNFLLSRQVGHAPEKTQAVSREILERLIDQELALERAADMKIDRDPAILQELDVARREILARAYAARVGAGASKPSAEEVQKYYNDNPALFKERRVYTFQDVTVEATPEQLVQLEAKLSAGAAGSETIEFMKVNRIAFAVTPAVRPAEQLPLNLVSTVAKMKEGQMLRQALPRGARLMFLVGSRLEPVDEARARPAIEQFLLNERRRSLVEVDIKALRTAAKIEYLGAFAAAPSAPASVAAAASGITLDDASIGKGLGTIK